MFEQNPTYPMAVTSPDDDGLRAGMAWCVQHMEDEDYITVWTHLKSGLYNNPLLEQFVGQYQQVDHVTARGGAYMHQSGPVLMAWADPTDIGDFIQTNRHRIHALCVVSWVEAKLRPWVAQAHPELLGDTTIWDAQISTLDQVVEEAMKDVTRSINHNNTITAGYDKEDVVSALLALHDAGYHLDGPAMEGWAIAHGWTGRNAAQLQRYAEGINLGKRPRVRSHVRQSSYVDLLRANMGEPKA